MKKLLLSAFFFIAGCQLPIEDKIPMSVDSYLSRTPPVKTAVIHLMNEDVSKDDIEYQQFLAKLKPVLESKGYRLTSPAAVILRLKFGVKKDGSTGVRSSIGTAKTAHPIDEPEILPTTMYDRHPIYEKFISLTAVQAGKEDRQFWKVTVSKKDYAPDFRSAEEKLLYLLSHFIEKDSGRMVSAELSDTEFYQRYVLKYSAAESSALFVTEPEVRRQYLRRLQIRINTHAADFRKCGLTEMREVSFMVSPFGTLPSFGFKETFDILGMPVGEKVRSCIAKYFEPLLEPPHDIDTTQPLTVQIPIR